MLFVFSQQNTSPKRISIANPSQNTIQQIQKAGIDLTCGPRFINNNLELELGYDELLELQKNGITYQVLIDDLTNYYSQRNAFELPIAKNALRSLKKKPKNQVNGSITQKSLSLQNILVGNPTQHDECSEINWPVPSNFQLGSMGGCLTVSETLAQLDLMRSLYPNLISIKSDASPTGQTTHGNSTGSTTWTGQTMYYVRISDNPDIDEPSEPETLITGMIHSREVNSLMNVMYFMWYILENYNSDPFIKNVVDNQELYFIPIINPDGLRWNEVIAPGGGGLQRKNLRPGVGDNGTTSTSNNVRGVDLNRNFNYYWGWDNAGSSPTTSSQTYRGPTAGSEPETQILQDFVLSHDIKVAVNHHGGLNSIVTSSYNGSVSAADSGREDEYAKICHDLTEYNRYIYGSAPNTLYEANGDTNDWMLGGVPVSSGGQTSSGSGKDVLAFAPENGDDFWPTPSQITPIAQKALRMNFLSVLYSGKFAKLHDLNTSDIVSTSGNLTFGVEYLGKTYDDITLTVTPVSSNITSITSPTVQTGWTKLEQRNLTVPYTLDAGIQPNDEIEFQVTLSNDDFVLYQANYVKYYQSNVLFQDNPDATGTSNWTIAGGSWGTTTDAYSGSTAITDSPSGAYGNNENKTITLNSVIDLSATSQALVQFYAKWDLERNYDLVQIEASTNGGGSWNALCGNYNKPPSTPETNYHLNKNSTTFRNHQSTNGDIVYEGNTMDKWVMEELYINATENTFLLGQNNVQFRFRFKSDSTNREDDLTTTFDGFTFDDFKIISIQTPCVLLVPTGVVASNITENEATITWDNIISATYDLRYRVIGTQNWTDLNGLTTPSSTLTGLANLTDYEVQVRANCSTSSSAYTALVNFTTLDVQLNYCASASTSVNDEFISRVQLNTINNTSTGQFYSDFTNISTTLTKDDQYTITITPTWTGQVYNESYSVWIDYNRDGDFEDAEEQVFSQGNTQATSVSGNFIIPSSAVENSTRMRVSMKYNAAPTSCETFQYGEVEDYTIIIESAGPDLTPPVITLNGASPIDITIGGTYTEEGATAIDDIDGDITSNIVIGGDVVNTNTIGTYVVTYNVNDAAGNTAAEVTRIVNITADVIPPVITLLGASTVNLTLGESYVEPGATAIDNVDGDLSTNITIAGDVVDSNVIGAYVITYNVSDNAGNSAIEVTRTVNVSAIVDNTAPVISLNGAASINLLVGDIYNELGATANDNIDGDLSGNISIGGDTVNSNLAGVYVVTYNVSDAAGNSADQVLRTVTVSEPVTGCSGGISAFPYAEGFEGSIGEWSQFVSDDLNWLVNSGTTPSSNTGPSGASEGTSYIYVEASVNGTGYPNKRAIIVSPCYDLSNASDADFSFQYHMFGATDMGTIDLEISNDAGGSWTSIWNQSGNQGNGWLSANIDLSIYTGGSIQLRFNRFVGSTWQADIAIDDISLITVEEDTTAPVITLNGNASIDINLGDTYIEQGATATDNRDGDITSSIVIGGDVVNTNVAGTYLITYDVSDVAGNTAAQVTRTVNVIPDTIAPVITLTGASVVDLNVGDVYTEEGATATDDRDGDITSSIVIGGDVVNTNVAGTYLITYDVSDLAGNTAAQVTRTVNVIPDITAPVIALIGSSPIDLNLGDIYNEQGATASDNIDGDISSNIVISGDIVNTNNVGTYNVTYNVSDNAGNAAIEVIRVVNVLPDAIAPIITLNGTASISLNVGDTYVEQGATAADNLDGDITTNIVITDNVNTLIAGTYFVDYNVSDSSGNLASTVTRTVNVIADTVAPSMALNGAATINLNVGDIYNEQGATASDNIDGDITSNIVIGGDVVNTSLAGTYTVTYNVSDASGNAATQLSRTVIVSPIANGCSGGIASFPYAEGFENTLGDWLQSSSDDLDWLVDANGTPSGNTGPSSATQGSFYLYVEASGNGTGYPNKRAILTSPCFDLSGLTQGTFSFKYHMFGASDMGTIALEISDDEGATWTSIWNESGNKGNSWQTVNINLSAYVGGGIQLRFNRFVGSTWQADIAIDDVSLIDEEIIIESCSGGITAYPYTESYENTLGGWTQSTADDINWTVDANGTPSSGTGPSSAITGSYYIYVEASGSAGYPNKRAIINSPCYDLTSAVSPTFSFNYHMYGSSDMGTIALEASNDNGLSWTLLWSESGNKGNSWQSAVIDLSAYEGNSVQLRFNRFTGGTWQADIAIDNISLDVGSAAAKDNVKGKFNTDLNTLTLYPNPVQDILNLKTLKGGEVSYRIINSLGQIVSEGKAGNRIIVDRLEAGMYFIEVTQEEDKMIKRFIKE